MAEKDSLHSVIDEVNQLHGDLLGYRIELLRWETHSAPGGGRPQAVINADIPVYDIFVGIAWRRFGTPTGVADSGTEEEYRVAYRLWEKNNSMPLMFYFCQKPFMPRTIEEVEQVKKVLSFRDELRQKALDWEYEGPEMFAGKIRKHICLRMRGLVQDNTGEAGRNQKSIEDLQPFGPDGAESSRSVQRCLQRKPASGGSWCSNPRFICRNAASGARAADADCE